MKPVMKIILHMNHFLRCRFSEDKMPFFEIDSYFNRHPIMFEHLEQIRSYEPARSIHCFTPYLSFHQT